MERMGHQRLHAQGNRRGVTDDGDRPATPLYDGSWSEWGTNASTPKATGAA